MVLTDVSVKNSGILAAMEAEMRKTPLTFALIMATVGFAGALSAKPALRDVAHVRDGIINVGIAYEISEVCPSLSARLFRGISFLNGLKSHARGLGYSKAEIDAYVDDNQEKKRLEEVARERLTALGAVKGAPQTYCAVGRSQIAAGSDIGRLLR